MNIRKIVKRILFIFNRNPIYKFIYSHEIKKRLKLPFTDIESLSKPISMFSPYTNEIHPPNDWYGHATNIKKFLGLPNNYIFTFTLEHGLYLSSQVDDLDIETNMPTLITYSTYRKKVLEKYRKHVFAIGPFIHYVQSILSEKQIIQERKKIGKTLLFFPAHSTPLIGIDYDMEYLCKQIKKIAKGYDRIRVCMYWKDVLLGKHKYFQEQGFECVTAGHMLDPNFLPRLKSLILTADLTLSNIISSQTGFCIYLKRPHIFLKNKFIIKTSKHWKKILDELFNSEGYTELAKEFSRYNFKITEKQKNLIRKYWGTDNIKSKSELSKIVKLSEKYYLNNND